MINSMSFNMINSIDSEFSKTIWNNSMAGLVLQRWSSRAVIVGLSDLSRKLTHQFKRNPLLRVGYMGFFDDRWSERLPEDKQCQSETRLGGIASTAEFVKAYNVQHIYIALPLSAQPRILALLDELRDTTASIYFVPDIVSFDLIQANISYYKWHSHSGSV